MSSSHHLTILRTSSLTIRENPRKRLGVGQLQILSPVVDSLSNRVNGCRWAVCETAAKLTSCRAAISPLRLCRVWRRPGLTGTHVCVLNGVGFISSERWPRGSTYPHGSLIRHSSTTFEAVVHHPPRGGCLYGWQSMSAKTNMPSEPDVDWSSSMGATHHDVLRQELPVIR